MDYTVPNPGRHELKLLFVSDSYVGVDLEDFEVRQLRGWMGMRMRRAMMSRLLFLSAIELIEGERGQLGDCNLVLSVLVLFING